MIKTASVVETSESQRLVQGGLPVIWSLVDRAVARKKLQPRRTHGPFYEISRMKSSNIISLIKKKKIDSIW